MLEDFSPNITYLISLRSLWLDDLSQQTQAIDEEGGRGNIRKGFDVLIDSITVPCALGGQFIFLSHHLFCVKKGTEPIREHERTDCGKKKTKSGNFVVRGIAAKKISLESGGVLSVFRGETQHLAGWSWFLPQFCRLDGIESDFCSIASFVGCVARKRWPRPEKAQVFAEFSKTNWLETLLEKE